MPRLPKAALVVAAVLAATACGASAGADPPKPPGYRKINAPGARDDLVTFCDHGTRLYVATNYGGVAAVPNDPTCVGVPK